MTSTPLGATEKSRAIALAREAVEATARHGRTPAPTADLDAPVAGVFVTLRSGEALRGCIGTTAGDVPLGRGIQQMAVAAATRDPRFSPVAEDELEGLSIEISVLGTPEPIAGPDDVVIGTHGLIVGGGGRRGLLLPQVASDHGLDPEQFLDAVCRKAGLPRGAWRQPGIDLARFVSEVFSEAPEA